MKSANLATGVLLFLTASLGGLSPAAHSQDATFGSFSKEAVPLLEQMAGTWNVKQRTWTGPGTLPIALPPAIARRSLIGSAYVQEIMELSAKSEKDAFTRTSYINYNSVEKRYEYFSLDSRAPQQMHYQSKKREKSNPGLVKLEGGTFVASQWGKAKNVAFDYRLTLGSVENDQQTVRLYLTPKLGQSKEEFLAFEYVYTRQR